MLKYIKSLFIRFILLWILSSIIAASIMYIYSKLKFYFRWGNNWNSERYNDWFYFVKMAVQVFPFLILGYLVFYWVMQSLFQIRIQNHKLVFLLIWGILLGIWIGIIVSVNTIGSITIVEFIKIAIISGAIGIYIPLLDFAYHKLSKIR